MKLGTYPSLDPWDQNRNVTKQWELYMHRTALTTGGWTCLGALGTLAYHLSVDRSNSALKELLAKGLARTPRVAATVGLCSIVSESVYFPFMNCLPPESSPFGNFISKTLLGGLVASSLGRNPRSAATTGLLCGTLMTSGTILEFCSASNE